MKILVWRALDVQAADLRRAHAEQGEAALMIGVDQLLRRRWRLRENTQPSERIIPLVNGKGACGNGGAADAVKAVAAGNEIAGEFGLLSAVLEKNPRPRSRKVAHADVLDFKKDRRAAGMARVDEVLDNFALCVNRDAAPGQIREIDAMRAPAEA